jgi:hypothetical protein
VFFSQENAEKSLQHLGFSCILSPSPDPTNQMNLTQDLTTGILIAFIFIGIFAVIVTIFVEAIDQKKHKKELESIREKAHNLPANKVKTMQTELDNLIAQTKGKFFSITFVKKDGSVRVINGKDKYQRLLKGGVNNVAVAGYVPFVNRNTETWASAHKDAVVTFRCGKLVKQVSP